MMIGEIVSSFDLPPDGSWLNLDYLESRIDISNTTGEDLKIPEHFPERPSRVDFCVFHAPCPDGTASAFAVGRAFPDCAMFGVNRGSDDTDAELPDRELFYNKNVVLVDYVYSKDLMIDLIESASSVTVVDHHMSEYDLLNELLDIYGREKFQFLYSDQVCAAVLCWKWLFPETSLPVLYQYINDNDTGSWLLPNVGWFRRGMGVASPIIRPGHSKFSDFQIFSEGLENGKKFLLSRMVMGMLACDIEWRDLRAEVQRSSDRQLRVCPEYWCRLVNVSHNSGGIHSALLEDGIADFSMTYFRVDCNGSWKCSLRSRDNGGVNVGAIAAKLGGGGHWCAASFTLRCENIEEIFVNEDWQEDEWDDYWGCYKMTECETLYVSNLNDKTKAADLQALLYELFAGHGEVVAVQLLKARPARGTAFVTMRTTAQATSAMKNLNNFPFLGKPANVQYAKKQSDELAKLNGTYKPRFKPKRLVH